MAWTDEQREEVVALYEAANPTTENSMEIVKEIADEIKQSANGVRIILSRAGVYIKKDETAKSTNSSGTTRVSKAASQEALTVAIEDAGQTADQEIINKLTGKAAIYLTGIINAITN